MKTSLLRPALSLIALILIISSCSTQYPKYTGRYHHKKQDGSTLNDNSSYSTNTRKKDKLTKIESNQAMVTTEKEEPILAGDAPVTIYTRPYHNTSKTVK